MFSEEFAASGRRAFLDVEARCYGLEPERVHVVSRGRRTEARQIGCKLLQIAPRSPLAADLACIGIEADAVQHSHG